MFIDAAHSAPALMQRLITGVVAPRPIAWIATRSAQGVDNLAPYSFFMAVSVQPPVLAFSQLAAAQQGSTSQRHKDTLANLLHNGQCVINVVEAAQLHAMNACSPAYAPDCSEFDAAGVQRAPSALVEAAGVEAARVRIECRLRQTLPVGEGPLSGTLVLLDVVGLHVDEALCCDGALQPERLDALGKLGGDFYLCASGGALNLPRPALPNA